MITELQLLYIINALTSFSTGWLLVELRLKKKKYLSHRIRQEQAWDKEYLHLVEKIQQLQTENERLLQEKKVVLDQLGAISKDYIHVNHVCKQLNDEHFRQKEQYRNLLKMYNELTAAGGSGDMPM
jgi:predicted nuclease with TOPRIM domain